MVGAAAAALSAETAGKGMAYLEHRLCNENAVVYGFQIKRERERVSPTNRRTSHPSCTGEDHE